MDSPVLSDIQKRVQDLCVSLHTELFSLVFPTQRDPQEDESFMNISEVLSLDTISALDHIEAAVKELISAKRELADMSQYSLLQEQEKYGHALQKLEGEVRGHIQAEHQMALHIEILQQKLEDEAKERKQLVASYDSLLEKMQKDYDSLYSKLREQRGDLQQKGVCRKGKSINDVQLRKLPANDLKSRDLETKLKKALFDQSEWDKMCQKLTKDTEETKSRGSNSQSDLPDSRMQTYHVSRMKRELDEALKETRRMKSKESTVRDPSNRSISPLLSTLRRDSSDLKMKETYKKALNKVKRQLKNRSASTERLRGNKSSCGLISSTLQ